MTRSSARRIVASITVMLLAAACAAPAASSPDAQPVTTDDPPPPPLRLPAGFPVMPGAEPLPVEEAGVAGRWRSGDPGPAVYSYYLAALPAAGYAAIETAPGGAVAIMRFADRGGTTWQLDLQAIGGPTEGTEIRLGVPRR